MSTNQQKGIKQRTRRTPKIIVMHLMACLCVNDREKRRGKGYNLMYKVIKKRYWQWWLYCCSYFNFKSFLFEVSWKVTPILLFLPGALWLTRQLAQLQSKFAKDVFGLLTELTITVSSANVAKKPILQFFDSCGPIMITDNSVGKS